MTIVMKKLPILFTVVALFCSSASAQERLGREKPRPDREKTEKQNERKAYGYRSGEIKIANPADWIKNLDKPIFSGPQPGEKFRRLRRPICAAKMLEKSWIRLQWRKTSSILCFLSASLEPSAVSSDS